MTKGFLLTGRPLTEGNMKRRFKYERRELVYNLSERHGTFR